MKFDPQFRPRSLVLVLGDQLDAESAAFDGFDRATDAVWMAEVTEESTHVWSHKARVALFLAAMRHFRDALRSRAITVHYHHLNDADNRGALGAELEVAVRHLRPERLIMVEPGEWRVRESLLASARKLGVPLEIRPDRHFLCSREEFAAHAAGRRQLRLEFFYREMRRTHRVLMDGNRPAGGRWNFDAENRRSFGPSGPPPVPPLLTFPPDAVTREVLALVEQRFPNHPGSLAHFDWPVTSTDAHRALADFIEHRLPQFGDYQDAMWRGSIASQPRGENPLAHRTSRAGSFPRDPAPSPAPPHDVFLFHSRLSAALNLKLLNPRAVISAAETAYRTGHAPLPAVEGFVRQILGWREFVRGIYWQFMPGYRESNALNATGPLPDFYWTGQTEMRCLREVIGQTLEFGYAHHIQRLMVTGLFALLLGVRPQAVHEWYLAAYVDAVEWVELPNTLGLSQFADGGLVASKPYVATGKYLQRMSNYCAGCRYDPATATGPTACPFTTLYWDFLRRHEPFLRQNPRMIPQLKNLARLDTGRRSALQRQAAQIRARCFGVRRAKTKSTTNVPSPHATPA